MHYEFVFFFLPDIKRAAEIKPAAAKIAKNTVTEELLSPVTTGVVSLTTTAVDVTELTVAVGVLATLTVEALLF